MFRFSAVAIMSLTSIRTAQSATQPADPNHTIWPDKPAGMWKAALPGEWPKGSMTGLRACGGFEVDLEWSDDKLITAALRAPLGGKASVRYRGHAIDLEWSKGESLRVNAESGILS